MTSPLSLTLVRVSLVAATLGLGSLAWYLNQKQPKMKRAVDGLKFVEREILEHAITKSNAGDAVSVYESIDDYCYSVTWAMNTGDKKGALVDKIIADVKPKLVLELGGYVGYSAIRFGHQQALATSDSGATPLYVSVEIDPLMAAIATKLIEHAGLETSVRVLVGSLSTTAEKIKALVARHTAGTPEGVSFDLVYIDHWKEQYVPDLRLLEELGFVRKGTVVVADNIIRPGAPEYLKFMTEDKKEEYESELIESTLEYMDVKDAMLKSTRK